MLTQTVSQNKPLLLLPTSLPLTLSTKIKDSHHALPMAFFIKPDFCVIPSWCAHVSGFCLVFLYSSHLLDMLFKTGMFALVEMDRFCGSLWSCQHTLPLIQTLGLPLGMVWRFWLALSRLGWGRHGEGMFSFAYWHLGVALGSSPLPTSATSDYSLLVYSLVGKEQI